jgi:Spy/CpxP family protein refolding chaperone
MFSADRMSWQNPRVLATLLLVFLSGALAGAITMRTGLHDMIHRSAPSSYYWPDDKREFSYERLKKELNLTPDQSERLKSILDDFAKYHQELQEQIEDVRATGRNRILQMLTPQQRERFKQLSNRLPGQ